MNFLNFVIRRRTRSIDLDNKVLEKAAQPQEASYGEAFRKAGHGLKRLVENDYFDLMKVNRNLRSANHSMKVLPNTIFKTADSQRVAQARVKNAKISS